MKSNELHIPYNAPLNDSDTEEQTYGCRQASPDICKYNGIEGICAFSSKDEICRRPSKSWKR